MRGGCRPVRGGCRPVRGLNYKIKCYILAHFGRLGSLMNGDFDRHVDFGNNFEQKNDHVPEGISIHN